MREAESPPTRQQLDELEREGKSCKEKERELQTELEKLQEDNEEMLSIRKQCIDETNACRQFDSKQILLWVILALNQIYRKVPQ